MGKQDLLDKVRKIVLDSGTRRVNGRVASHATLTSSRQSLNTIFSDLWELGFRLSEPQNLRQQHIEALIRFWHSHQIALSTIHERLSRLRTFCRWLGKSRMVKSLPDYLPDVDPASLRIRRVATKSKSWSENGIDLAQLIPAADRLDARFGLMLRAVLWFGLRRKEVLHMQPWGHDHGNHLEVIEGKGGRPRNITLDPNQRIVLEQIKAGVGKNEHLGWYSTARGARASLKYNYSRYNKLMAKIGLTRNDLGATGHGGRAQFLESLSMTLGMVPATLGGGDEQLPPAMIDVIRRKVSAAAGHNRLVITTAYCGSTQAAAPDPGPALIRQALAMLNPCAVPPERLADCALLAAVLNQIGVDATPGQVLQLWERVNQRFGETWHAVPENPIALLRFAAGQIVTPDAVLLRPE